MQKVKKDFLNDAKLGNIIVGKNSWNKSEVRENYFVSKIRSHASKYPVTILIDGPDLCGKSTTVQELSKLLESQGLSVLCCKGLISPSFFHSWLCKLDANKSHSSGLLNSLYLISAFFDRGFSFIKNDYDILICESHVDRVIAYGLTFNLKSLAKISLSFRNFYRKFDARILLVASHATRSDRLYNRKSPTLIDRKTCTTETVTDFFCENFKKLYQSRECLIIPTDKKTLDVVISEIIDHLITVISEQPSNDNFFELERK
ncbi:hypothetical protein MKL42_01340 [Acinetobacter sp. AOR15_HL]|uniref:hypothetical protein n=1 Tax=unclassified Acinetobacter TaxID=196816 RepID=UPI0022EA6454|nr:MULTISPECIES: hypothetical protein [unclassified Acinetobacter]MDA3556164.1 hypothetical protein [Acinetobacter sp. AOR15_HL]MDA3571621.1 hypothetical protein [Acinetobacter sp. AOR14_HL]